ncbi:MAG TPA: NUDIX domain-containing protein [Spirochaetia bacterium]|nr:NUDIX domain-containing protein [Spirochaetia bacterium]
MVPRTRHRDRPQGTEPLQDAAVRESREELGIRPESVEPLGVLSTLLVHGSNRLVLTLAGWVPERPSFKPNPHEVAEILEVRLEALLDSKTRRREVWQPSKTVSPYPRGVFAVSHPFS